MASASAPSLLPSFACDLKYISQRTLPTPKQFTSSWWNQNQCNEGGGDTVPSWACLAPGQQMASVVSEFIS